MIPRVAVAGVSLILVVGVVIGVASTMGRKHSFYIQSSSTLETGMKAAESLCEPCDYKESCKTTLGPVAMKNDSVTYVELFTAIIEVAKDEIYKVSNNSKAMFSPKDPKQQMTLEDCKDLFSFAVDELDATLNVLGGKEGNAVALDDHIEGLKDWLSSVISLSQTCVDQIDDPEIKSAMSNELVNTTQTTSNALAIVNGVSKFLDQYSTSTTSSHSRKLLQTTVDKEGYPTWFSSADRKLLAKAGGSHLRPNAIVAKDGSGQFTTINAALNAYPKGHKGRYVIYVKAGIYNEYVLITKEKPKVFMYGDGPRKTIVTGSKSVAKSGLNTMRTATFAIQAHGFIAKSMAFRNTAGPEGHQAVALRVQSKKSAFYNCRIDGYQDTLYAQTHNQFYRNCVISGTVDFIFGDSKCLIQNSKIILRRPMDNQQNTVTAHGRDQKQETTGLVLQNCEIVPERRLVADRFKIPSYLGRPWKEYSRTVIMESSISDAIKPEGWMPWSGNFALDTCYYAEYANRGPGSNTKRRVKWGGYKVIDKNEALQFTANAFMRGGSWISKTGAPVTLGLVY